ncbi:MAG: proton-conducting transporter membrane subunit [Chloroflexota bacterium]
MSAPLVWIGLPALVGVILLFLRLRDRVAAGIAASVTCGLTLLAIGKPPGGVISLFFWSTKLEPVFTVLGREFILTANDRWLLVMLYATMTLWFLGGMVTPSTHLLGPIGLGLIAFMIAALAVEPFLYAALLLQMAVFLSVPLLVPPHHRPGRGILRYVSVQTLGMPLLLLTGWLLGGIETAPVGIPQTTQALVLMGIGFGALLAVFPFHTWVPMVLTEVPPYVGGFVAWLLPLAVSLFGLGFFDRYIWLRETTGVYSILQTVGILMVISGGLWAAVQRQMGRMLGFFVIVEIGLSLLTISSGVVSGGPLFFALLLPRFLALFLWSLSLSGFRLLADDDHSLVLRGMMRRFPFAGGVLVLSQLTLAGFPLLPGFPTRLALYSRLVSEFPLAAASVLLASGGMMIAVVRTLTILVGGGESGGWQVSEGLGLRIFLSIGVILLLLGGLLPQTFLPFGIQALQSFPHILP